MKASLLVIRAIGTEFANRVYTPVVIMAALLSAILIGGTLWLTTISLWWWLLGIPVVIAVSIVIAFSILIKLIIRYVMPSQTKAQRRAIKQFVDKLQTLSDVIQTPKVILLFRLARDVAAPTKDGFVGNLSHTSLSLKKDFSALLQSFRSDTYA